jgi:hypothetical protein
MHWLERVRRPLHDVLRFAKAHKRSLATGIALFVVAAWAFRWARKAAGFWGIDDAGITYAAAFELADHHSLAPYLEGTPVEDYSNPLLFFVVAFLRVIGLFNPVTTHVYLEMIVFALMVTLVWRVLRSVTGDIAAVAGAIGFAALELVTPATWIWYGSGLESVWVSAGLVALLWICVRTSRGLALSPAWGALAFFVSITRPEAPVYVAGFYLALFAFARPSQVSLWTHARQVARALAVTTVLFLLFLCWRRIGYGDWLPNTYYAKLYEKHHLAKNLREYVVPGILPYCRSALFATSVFALLVTPKMETIAQSLVVFLLASLALPITAGADWMGENRFATTFLAVSHVAYAAFFAVCIARLSQASPRNWRVPYFVTVVTALLVPALLYYDRIAIRDRIDLNEVTIAIVAELQGGERWEHQMRLGLPYPVVMLPDAGGSLLVGGMQLLDNGYLADFQMSRIGRNYPDPTDHRVLNQYQHEERRPDLVDDNRNFALDHSFLGTTYLSGEGRLFAKRDLVEVAEVDPGAQLLFEDGHVQVYLSNETVRTAAPGALVRCELIVAWKDIPLDEKTQIRGAVEGGDRDEQSLKPYQPGANGIERRALLLGAPNHAGSFAVSIELVREGQVTFTGRAFALEVSSDDATAERAATKLLEGAPPMQTARRIAWLREQWIPRLGMTEFRSLTAALRSSSETRSPKGGKQLMRLRWNARLATLEDLPQGIRTAEDTAMRRMFATCPVAATGDAGLGRRIVCLGRVVDQLRRLGYLATLSRMPEIGRELSDAESDFERLAPSARYQALVGLTLATPSDIALQRKLLAQRLELGIAGAFPEI